MAPGEEGQLPTEDGDTYYTKKNELTDKIFVPRSLPRPEISFLTRGLRTLAWHKLILFERMSHGKCIKEGEHYQSRTLKIAAICFGRLNQQNI